MSSEIFGAGGGKCESQIFPPVTGGATQMCKDMEVPLISQIPLEPNLLLSAEKG